MAEVVKMGEPRPASGGPKPKPGAQDEGSPNRLPLLIGGLIAALVVIGGLVFFLTRPTDGGGGTAGVSGAGSASPAAAGAKSEDPYAGGPHNR